LSVIRGSRLPGVSGLGAGALVMCLGLCGAALPGCPPEVRDSGVPFCERRGADEQGFTYRAQCWDTPGLLPQVAVCPAPWPKPQEARHPLVSAITPDCLDEHGRSGRGTSLMCPGDEPARCVPLETLAPSVKSLPPP
jgi:hypothetical protein